MDTKGAPVAESDFKRCEIIVMSDDRFQRFARGEKQKCKTGDPPSAAELKRLENMDHNRAHMEALGLEDPRGRQPQRGERKPPRSQSMPAPSVSAVLSPPCCCHCRSVGSSLASVAIHSAVRHDLLTSPSLRSSHTTAIKTLSALLETMLTQCCRWSGHVTHLVRFAGSFVRWHCKSLE